MVTTTDEHSDLRHQYFWVNTSLVLVKLEKSHELV